MTSPTLISSPLTVVLPNELWTEHVIKEVLLERNKYHNEDLTFQVGNLISRDKFKIYHETSFTLTALKRTCKAFEKNIRPYVRGSIYRRYMIINY
jgi:hypothetical protein